MKMRNFQVVDTTGDLNNTYFLWLCSKVHIGTRCCEKSYWILARTLHAKEFFWLVPNDDNRGKYGQKLRQTFAEETPYAWSEVDRFIQGPCSMFEMLIALAMGMNDMMTSVGWANHTPKWFWEMMSNTGLDQFTDERYTESVAVFEIDKILDTILDRSYKMNGKYGLFPLKNPKKDQRKVEIWYQMCAYLLENYELEG